MQFSCRVKPAGLYCAWGAGVVTAIERAPRCAIFANVDSAFASIMIAAFAAVRTVIAATITMSFATSFIAAFAAGRTLAVRAFTARCVMGVMRTLLRHRQMFAAHIADDFNRLFHQLFDGFDFRPF